MPWQEVVEGQASWSIDEGDCRDLLAAMPDACVDHVITDPPYDAEAHQLQRRIIKRPAGSNAYGQVGVQAVDFDALDAPTRHLVAANAARLVRRWAMAFCQAESVGAWRDDLVTVGLVWKRACVWIKPNGQPSYTGDRPGQGYESIAVAHVPGRTRWNAGGKLGLYTYLKDSPSARKREHVTQKPLLLMEALIRDFTDPSDIVLDPFAGSGTTGVAARRLGRRFIGFELSPHYAAIARRRIGETAEQVEWITDEAFRREAKRKREQLGLTFDDEEQDE